MSFRSTVIELKTGVCYKPLREYLLKSYRDRTITIEDLRWVYTEDDEDILTDHYMCKVFTILIDEELASGGDAKELLQLAFDLWDRHAYIDFCRAVVPHGSDKLITKYLRLEYNYEDEQEMKNTVLINYIRYGLKKSREHMMKVIDIASEIETVDFTEAAADYLTVSDGKYNSTIAIQLVDRCDIDELKDLIVANYSRKDVALERLNNLDEV